MDGSEHMFWKGETTVLIAAIDDATSDVPYGEFYKSEDTINCMDVVEKIIKIKEIPKYIYTDRAGWLAQELCGYLVFQKSVVIALMIWPAERQAVWSKTITAFNRLIKLVF